MNFIKKYNLVSLGIISGLTLVIISATNRLILTRRFFAESGQTLALPPGNGLQLLTGQQQWVDILAILYFLFKIGLVSLILYTALYIADRPIAYSLILYIVTLCEAVFLVAAVVKMLWFYFFFPQGTLLDWHRFYAFSVLSLFHDVPPDWYYPLQTLNLFEISYWFFLAYGISKLAGMNYGYAFKIVALSYLPALLVWMVVVCFCAIMYFPSQG